MKKLAIASIIAIAATSASALEIGANVGRSVASERNTFGLTLGHRVHDRVTVTAGYDREYKGADDQHRFSLLSSYDVVTVGPVTFDVRGGVAYLENEVTDDGVAALVGVGLTLPIDKNTDFTASLVHQQAEGSVKGYNGNRVAVGVKYSF